MGRRANEGWFSETVSGDLERECIEESCDDQEFHEVYDDLSISEPKYIKYLDCLNYINKSDRQTAKGKDLLRGCVNASNQGPQRPQEPQQPQKPQQPQRPQTTKRPVYHPTIIPTELPTIEIQTVQPGNNNQYPQGKNEALPSCYEAGSYGFLCGEPIPNGFPNKNDPLFQAIDLKLNASRLNRVHCKAIPQKGFTGKRVVDCTINFEAWRRVGLGSGEVSCTATTTITQAADKVVMTPLVEECQR